jgi:hypothetical protein
MRKTLFMGVLILTLVLMVSLAWAGKKGIRPAEPAKPIAGLQTYCVEIDVDMPSQVYLGTPFTVSASILNCSDVGGLVEVTFEIYKEDHSFHVGPLPANIFMAAGEELSRSVKLELPPAEALAGTYIVHVTAEFGDASDEDTATITLLMP